MAVSSLAVENSIFNARCVENITSSDHRLVVARFDLPEAYRVMSRRAGRPENHRLVDAAGLACDPIKREEYQNRITDELSTSSTLMSGASPGE